MGNKINFLDITITHHSLSQKWHFMIRRTLNIPLNKTNLDTELQSFEGSGKRAY